MNSIRVILYCLLASLAACAAPDPPAASSSLASQPSLPLPQPLKIASAQRLGVKPDPRTPPADFGKAIALGEGVLAVGAPAETMGPEFPDPGSVYVYRRDASGWEQEAILSPGEPEADIHDIRRFGTALALQYPFLYIGAPETSDLKGTNTGAVYVFEHGANGWKEIAILKSPDPAPQAKFGTQIKISGEHLGVLQDNPYQGSLLRLFQGRGVEWRQTAVIQVELVEGARAGIGAFDLFVNTLAVGIMSFKGEEADAQISGEVQLHRFDGETWVKTGSLRPNVIGNDIALDGGGKAADRLAVSSNSSLNGFMSGAILIFERNGEDWRLVETLGAPDVGSYMYWGYGFGGPVALKDDLLLAGGPGYSEDTFWDGVAYLYQFYEGRWVDQLRLVPTEDGGSGDFFGSSLAVYENTLLVSAPDEFGNAVYVYDVAAR